jgi:hypothetical protein
MEGSSPIIFVLDQQLFFFLRTNFRCGWGRWQGGLGGEPLRFTVFGLAALGSNLSGSLISNADQDLQMRIAARTRGSPIFPVDDSDVHNRGERLT